MLVIVKIYYNVVEQSWMILHHAYYDIAVPVSQTAYLFSGMAVLYLAIPLHDIWKRFETYGTKSALPIPHLLLILQSDTISSDKMPIGLLLLELWRTLVAFDLVRVLSPPSS